tara:strand:+ start:11204 stop:11779 length:576 start_codon:yes stop_codon:yes gene_type:complete
MSRKAIRCEWCENDPLYTEYHDVEWGVPVYDDSKIFETLILETFQAGLSWITILRKRENFRTAFDNFDYTKIANYSDQKLEDLMQNSGIIKNRLKIDAVIKNAQAFINIQKKTGTFSKYLWSFVDGKPIQNNIATINKIPIHTPLSYKISKSLKSNGFKFVGPKTVYAHMQAIGMTNDHTINCFRYKEIKD